jgi:hypothetical protein
MEKLFFCHSYSVFCHSRESGNPSFFPLALEGRTSLEYFLPLVEGGGLRWGIDPSFYKQYKGEYQWT